MQNERVWGIVLSLYLFLALFLSYGDIIWWLSLKITISLHSAQRISTSSDMVLAVNCLLLPTQQEIVHRIEINTMSTDVQAHFFGES